MGIALRVTRKRPVSPKSPGVSEIQEYLQELSEEGLPREAGEFSLAAQHARHKLREFQLKQPGLWLLKATQAGAHLNCRKVTVRQTREYLSIGFDPRFDPQLLLDLLRDIHNLGVLRDPIVGHFAWAIQAALATDPHRLNVEFHLDDRGPQAYEITETGAVGLARAPELPPGVLQLVRHEAPAKGLSALMRHFKWVKSSQADIDALRQRARFFPNPVVLDGLSLNDPTPEFSAGYPIETFQVQQRMGMVRGELWSILWSSGAQAMALPDPAQRLEVPVKILVNRANGYAWQPLHVVRVRDHLTGRELFQGSPYNFAWAKGQVQGDTFFVPYPRYRSACPTLEAGGVFSSERKPLCGLVHLTWNVGGREPAKLIPVHLGLQLDPIEVDFPNGVVALVSSGGWSTDLSQLQVIRDDHFNKTLASLTPLLEELRLELIDMLRVPKLARKCLVKDEERGPALALLQQIKLVEADL